MDVLTWFARNWELLLVGAVPVVVSLVSLTLSVRSLRFEKYAAQAAMRSAEAAEHANVLTERLLAREHLVERPETEPANVSWKIENPNGSRYVLRNVGTEIAEEVTIPPELMGGVTKLLPERVTIRPGGGAEFLVFGRLGSPVPHTAYVQWRGQVEPIPVPMP